MSLVQTMTSFGESVPLPDAVTRAAINLLVGRTRRVLSRAPRDADRAFASAMAPYPIAINTADANAQHYEIPADFFALVLGPQRKYSSCLYDDGIETLAAAEERALASHRRARQPCRRPAHSRTRLRLGLAVAVDGAAFPGGADHVGIEFKFAARIHRGEGANRRAGQSRGRHRRHERISAGGPLRPRGVGRDVRAHGQLAAAVASGCAIAWKPTGACSCMSSATAHASYRFDVDDKADWIAQHYFTGGIMPSHGLIRQFSDCFYGRCRMAVERPSLSAHRAGLAANFDRNARSRVRDPRARLWPRRRGSGNGAGGCSFWRPPDCSATRAARNGVSAITA